MNVLNGREINYSWFADNTIQRRGSGKVRYFGLSLKSCTIQMESKRLECMFRLNDSHSDTTRHSGLVANCSSVDYFKLITGAILIVRITSYVDIGGYIYLLRSLFIKLFYSDIPN